MALQTQNTSAQISEPPVDAPELTIQELRKLLQFPSTPPNASKLAARSAALIDGDAARAKETLLLLRSSTRIHPSVLARLTADALDFYGSEIRALATEIVKTKPASADWMPVYERLSSGSLRERFTTLKEMKPHLGYTYLAAMVRKSGAPSEVLYAVTEIAGEHDHGAIIVAPALEEVLGVDAAEIANLLLWARERQKVLTKGAMLYETASKDTQLDPAVRLSLCLAATQLQGGEVFYPTSLLREMPWEDRFTTLWQAYFKELPESINQQHFAVLDQLFRVADAPAALKAYAFDHLFARADEYSTPNEDNLVTLLAEQPWQEEYRELWQRFIDNSTSEIRGKALIAAFKYPAFISAVSVVQRLKGESFDENELLRFLVSTGDEAATRAWSLLTGNDTEKERAAYLAKANGLSLSADQIPHEPKNEEAIALVLQAIARSPDGFAKLHQAHTAQGLRKMVRDMLAPKDPGHLDETIKAVLESPPHNQNHSFPIKLWPRAEIPHVGIINDRQAGQSMAVIGDGPAAILIARMRHQMGYRETVIIGENDKVNGIWNQRNVLREGHNTFSSLNAFGAKLDASASRPGEDLIRFLDRLAAPFPAGTHLPARAIALSFSEKSNRYVATVRRNGHEYPLEFDSVCIATGNGMPKSLRYGPMSTNADDAGFPIARWQQPIAEPHYKSFHNTQPLLVGLGNSTMAMVGEFIKMRKAGVAVAPVILTHYSEAAIRNPEAIVRAHSGNFEGPLFRTRADLSKIAGDMPTIHKRYQFALDNGWIIPSVVRWHVAPNADGSAEVTYHYGSRSARLPQVRKIWALIGYQNDPSLMAAFGCVVDKESGLLKSDPLTGRVETHFAHANRLYVVGAAATRPGDRNQEVIPGMMRLVPQMLLADYVMGFRV